MKASTTYEALRRWEQTGLELTMNSAEREEAWLKAGMSRNDTERFHFMTALIKLNTVVIDGKYFRQYF